MSSTTESRLAQLPYVAWVLLITLVSLIKVGPLFVFISVDNNRDIARPGDSLTAMSYGFRTLAWLIHLNGPWTYVLLSLCITPIAIAIIAWSLKAHADPTTGKVRFALLMGGSLAVPLFGHIGRHDALTILGAIVLITCARQAPRISAVGTLVMMLGNPEQAIIIIFCAVLLSLADPFRAFSRVLAVNLILALAGAVALSIWSTSTGSRTRGSFLSEFLGNSLYSFFGHLPLSIYAAYSVAWPIVLFALFRIRGRQRAVAALGLIAIPFILTAITLDQTRVFVCLSSATLTMVVLVYASRLAKWMSAHNLPVLTATLATVIVMPIIDIVGYLGHVRLPYSWVFETVLPALQNAAPL